MWTRSILLICGTAILSVGLPTVLSASWGWAASPPLSFMSAQAAPSTLAGSMLSTTLTLNANGQGDGDGVGISPPCTVAESGGPPPATSPVRTPSGIGSGAVAAVPATVASAAILPGDPGAMGSGPGPATVNGVVIGDGWRRIQPLTFKLIPDDTVPTAGPGANGGQATRVPSAARPAPIPATPTSAPVK